jgi:hypothetical protein
MDLYLLLHFTFSILHSTFNTSMLQHRFFNRYIFSFYKSFGIVFSLVYHYSAKVHKTNQYAKTRSFSIADLIIGDAVSF